MAPLNTTSTHFSRDGERVGSKMRDLPLLYFLLLSPFFSLSVRAENPSWPLQTPRTKNKLPRHVHFNLFFSFFLLICLELLFSSNEEIAPIDGQILQQALWKTTSVLFPLSADEPPIYIPHPPASLFRYQYFNIYGFEVEQQHCCSFHVLSFVSYAIRFIASHFAEKVVAPLFFGAFFCLCVLWPPIILNYYITDAPCWL